MQGMHSKLSLKRQTKCTLPINSENKSLLLSLVWVPGPQTCWHGLSFSVSHLSPPLPLYVSVICKSRPLQPGPRRSGIERVLVQNQCWIFVASWTGVIRYHGPKPSAVRSNP